MPKAPAFLKPLREKLRKYRLHVWLLEGRERHSGEELTILYAGHLLNKNYIAHLAYGDDHRETRLGKAWTWSVARIAKAHPAAALIFTETEEAYFNRFAGPDDFYIPCWIDGEIEFARYNELVKHSETLKSDIRKIRKQGYTYEISRDKDKFDLFYYEMYRPYILKAHGNRAALMSYEAMMSKASITELLLIRQGDEYVAGENLLYENGSVRAWSLGVRDGDYRHVKEGAIGALYYYKIEYLSGRGFARFDAGASRAFLKDGVLQYKRKWGLRLTRPRAGGFCLRKRCQLTMADTYIFNNPFIHSRNQILYGLVVTGSSAAHHRKLSEHPDYIHDIPGIAFMEYSSSS